MFELNQFVETAKDSSIYFKPKAPVAFSGLFGFVLDTYLTESKLILKKKDRNR